MSGYYYTRCTAEQKAIYNALLSGIRKRSEKVKLPMRPINEMSMVFNRVLLDNPIIFYTSSFGTTNDMYKKRCLVRPEYKYTQSFTKASTATVANYLQALDTAKGKSDLDKELFVHDYCLNNFRYDDTFGDYSDSILGPILNKTAHCEGIAKFVKLALDYLGVKCLVVSGKARDPAPDSKIGGHAWNIVSIDGENYHLDVTFDIALKGKTNRYDYFNLSDGEIKKDHIIIDDVPKCTIKRW